MVSEIDQGLHAPTKIPKDIKMVKEEAAPPPPSSGGVAGMSGMAGGSSSGIMGGMLGGAGTAPVVVAAKPKPPAGPARISSGVVSGLKLSGQTPQYPAIARAAHVGGSVVLHAIISKSGSIESLTVVSGSPMLQDAALEAVKTWRYKPYLLNGDPTEVDTTITVNFNLSGG